MMGPSDLSVTKDPITYQSLSWCSKQMIHGIADRGEAYNI